MKNSISTLTVAVLFASGHALAQTTPTPSFEPNSVQTVDFQNPPRAYLRHPGSSPIFYEEGLQKGDPALAAAALAKLSSELDAVFSALPAHTHRQLRAVPVYLMWGERSPLGGIKGGMRYVNPGSKNPLWDPRWQGGVVVYSADTLMRDRLWTRKALTHEMAHAWSLSRLKSKDPIMYVPWENAARQGLYSQVKDYAGRTVPSAYAGKNQLEYFAELSAAYFVGLNYHPFDRQGLMRHDPAGYRMVESVWALP